MKMDSFLPVIEITVIMDISKIARYCLMIAAAGEEIFISYGSHSNDVLLTECTHSPFTEYKRQFTYHYRRFHSRNGYKPVGLGSD